MFCVDRFGAVKLTPTQINLSIIFIGSPSAYFSKKTLMELLGIKTENCFNAQFSKFRKKLENIKIIDDVTASSFILTDILRGNLDYQEIEKRLEKRPFHFNKQFADILQKNDADLNLSSLSRIRTKPTIELGRLENLESFKKSLLIQNSNLNKSKNNGISHREIINYGPIQLDLNNKTFSFWGNGATLSNMEMNIARAYIALAKDGGKVSSSHFLKIINTNDSNFKNGLFNLREKLKGLHISGDIDADALFISRHLIGNLDFIDLQKNLQKTPYEFNTKLVHLMNEYGRNIPSESLSEITLQRGERIGRLNKTGKFHAALG